MSGNKPAAVCGSAPQGAVPGLSAVRAILLALPLLLGMGVPQGLADTGFEPDLVLGGENTPSFGVRLATNGVWFGLGEGPSGWTPVLKLGFVAAGAVVARAERTTVEGLARWTYRDLWPGIDLVYEARDGQLKYSFVVQPGADPRRVLWFYEGASRIQVAGDGSLAVVMATGLLRDDVPVAYQEQGGERREVSASFALEGDGSGSTRVGFEIGPYDPGRPLILDPVVKLIGFETLEATPSEIVSLGAGATVSATVRPGSGQRSLRQAATASVLAAGMTPALNTLGLRFSFRKPVNPGANQTLLSFMTGAANQWALQLTTSGQLQVQDLTTLTFVGPALGSTALSNNTWYTIRLAYDAAAGGILRVWLDAALEISITHTNAGTAVDQVQALGPANPNQYFYDDFYLADTATQPPLGQIVRIGVNGPGYRSDFDTITPLGTEQRELNVDEIPPSDADYDGHAAPTLATDLYALQPSPAGTINAVKGMWRMRTDAGSPVGGTPDYAWRVLGVEGSQAFAGLGTSFTLKEVVWDTPPGIGGSWTQAEVEGLELGARHNGTQAQATFISWTAAMVDYVAGSGAAGPTCGTAARKPWYNPSWQYRKAILVDHTKVAGDLVDFPVLVSLAADAGLAAHARGDGFDILFTDEDGTTKLSHQREAYDGAGTLLAWVKVPLVTTGADKLIFMYYGNPSSVDQQSINPTWTNGYQAVWHLSEASGAGAYIRNSALNNYHGTPTGTAFNATGKIDGARTFSNAAYSYVDIGGSTGTLFHRWSQFAFEFWVYPDYASDAIWEAAGEDQLLYGNTGPVRLARVRRFNYNAAGTGELQIDVQFNTAGTFFEFGGINRNAWNHVVFTYQGSDFQVFFNGVEDSRTLVPDDRLTNAAYLLLGLDNTSGALNGSLDEVRISNAGRSSEWIRTEYANQNAPATFCSVCFEQDVSTTAVRLMSFEAAGSDAAVDVAWRTGSEVDNLGFNVYRALGEDGPWTRLNASLVPGQGFSATGAAYAWHDGGLENGRRYFYRLEDVDTHAVATSHGPVSAVPQPAGAAPAPAGGTAGEGAGASGATSPDASCPAWALAQLGTSVYRCQAYGAPGAPTFRVLSRSPRSLQVELETPGFLAARDASGRVRVLVPDFDSLDDPLAPALPRKRAALDAVVGRTARIRSVQAQGLARFPGLLPAAAGQPQALVLPDGTVRPGRRAAALPTGSRGLLPRELARLAGERFLGEQKSLSLELVPLRYDASRGALVLARRLLVTIDFALREASESGQGRVGRRIPEISPESTPVAFLATSASGLHAVSFESLFPGRRQPLRATALRLTRDRGRTIVPFHVEPDTPSFGPGSRLFFHADSLPASTAFSSEVVYALESATGGAQMALLAAAPGSQAPASSRASAAWETNRIYLPGLLEAQDLWQWEFLLGGTSTTKSFSLPALDASSSENARLVVQLQGGSDAAAVVDHHVRVLCNGVPVAEESFDGAVPHAIVAELPASLLRADAANELTVQNVGDTGVVSSVFLDRFALSYPQTGAAQDGLFDGVFASAGVAKVAGLPAPAAVVDVSSASWLTRYEAGASLRFRTEPGHRYLAASSGALLAPRVFFPPTGAGLRQTGNQADYVLVAPQAFLEAAQPLLARRQSQGLTTVAASLEEIASAFGGGEASAEAIHDFICFAYHRWRRPSPRYVLLVGDSNYDPRRFNATSQPAPLPFLLQKSSYLWTASDPALAAVNGDDLLPDLALGRLPAGSVEQARAMVAKILDWEDQGYTLDGPAALVADDPDTAGDFEADVRDIQSSFLGGRPVTSVLLGQIGNPDVARQRILGALDSGLSLISYVGHGGAAVWASENILNSWDAPSLLAQPRQPLMLTLSCLNGYFVAPTYDSLAEAFLKAEGRGTIAAFAPSGLSLDEPAHLYHRAVVGELTSGRHDRLGDALVAAQQRYLQTGAFPELLDLYQLLGDPALKLR